MPFQQLDKLPIFLCHNTWQREMQKGILDRVEENGMRESPPLVVMCSVLKEEDLKEENKWWCANTH